MATPGGLVDKQELIDAQLDTAHLGRVVNSKDASGNPISESTNRTGGVNKTLDALEADYLEAIRAAGGEPLNGGVWAAGQTFTAYNQFMVYNGISYKPLTTTTLPYGPTGVAPDTSFVGPYEVSGVTTDKVGDLTNYYSENTADMISGVLIGGDVVSHTVGQVWYVGESAFEVINTPVSDIDDFSPIGRVTVRDYGINPSKTSPLDILDAIQKGVKFKIPQQLYTLSYAVSQIGNGDAFNIAAYGDSTYDGAGSTTDGSTPATVFNRDFLVGGNVPDGFSNDHDDSQVPNSWVNILQRILRDYFSNTVTRMYNAGYRSQRLDNGWAARNVHNAIYANSSYVDTKMLFLGFGLNDSNAYTGVDKSQLVEDTYNNTVAIVLDAFERGVQPVILTNVITGRVNESNGYSNYNVDQFVDNVKRQVAKEFNLEIIDISDFFNRYIQTNGEFITYVDINDDELHQNDFGYLKQAEFVFKEICGNLLIPNVTDMDGIGPGNPASRLAVDYSNLSSGTTANRGVSTRFRNVLVTQASTIAIEGSNLYDVYVWNEARDLSIEYDYWDNKAVDASLITDMTKVLRLRCSSKSYLVGTPEDVVDIPMPDFYGSSYVGIGQLGMPVKVYMKDLEYGLNRLTVVVPENVEVAHQPAQYFVGAFRFSDRQGEEVRYISFDGASTAPDEFNSDGYLTLQTNEIVEAAGAESITPLDYKEVLQNRTGVPYVGAKVQFKINCEWGNSSGIVLGYGVYDPSSVPGISVDVNKYAVMGESLILYSSTTVPDFKFQVLTAGLSVLETLDTGVDWNTYQNKSIIVEIERDSLTTVAVRIKTLDGTVLYAGVITDGRGLKLLSGMYCGGNMFKTAGATGFKLNKLSLKPE